MKKYKATSKILLDKRNKNRDGTYPIKLRVTFRRKQKYYLTHLCLTEGDWETVCGINAVGNLKDIREKLAHIQGKAFEIIEGLQVFSFEEFEHHIYDDKSNSNSVVDFYFDYIRRLTHEQRISTAISYENSINSIRDYKANTLYDGDYELLDKKSRVLLRDKQSLEFKEVTVDFLQNFEQWMLRSGNSLSTVGIYLRSLRAIFNMAMVDAEVYPFGRRKYQIPATRNFKKAITIEEVRAIVSYQVKDGSTEQRAKDFWVFSYLCIGINLKDIAQLKFKDVDGDYIQFVRAKTQRTTRSNQRPIRFFLHPIAREILNRWCNTETSHNDYLFPIINESMSPQKQHAVIHQFAKVTNKYIRKIASDLGIEKDVTTYVARHTFSTVLKRAGVSIEYISDALGHMNKKTTVDYLDSFLDETLEINTRLLL
jgi:integrase/recombinase XerD